MEDHLVGLLTATQSSNGNERRQAELTLKQAKTNDEFPLALARIGGHTSVPMEVRQAALSTLRLFIEANWNPEDADSEEPIIQISEPTKEHLKAMLLELVLNPEDERKIKTAASYGVSKIAMSDFPDNWQNLLPTVLHIMPTGTDVQVRGALVILQDLVEESLSDVQFFRIARDIIQAVHEVAMNENRKSNLRALAVRVFCLCFDLMDTVDDINSKKEVKAFANEILRDWLPFFEHVVKLPLSASTPGDDKQPADWYGPITLKIQVLRTLGKIKSAFAALLLPESMTFFECIWTELERHHTAYQNLYLETHVQGRLEDNDGLPYTLDYLVMEELDMLNELIRASPVQKELQAQIQAHGSAGTTPWVLRLIESLTKYARITQEDGQLWEFDPSIFLSEEAEVSTEYTARNACADLFIKVGQMLKRGALDGLLAYARTLFGSGQADWRSQEAVLYLYGTLATEFDETDTPMPEENSHAFLEMVQYAVNANGAAPREDEALLRARGYIVAGKLASFYDPACSLLQHTVYSMTQDPEELVQVATISALQGYVDSGNVPKDLQPMILAGIRNYLDSKDLGEADDADDLLATLAAAVRGAIQMDRRTVLAPDSNALDLLFLVARYGARSFQVTVIVTETFEDIVETHADLQSYTALCAKVLPSLTGALQVGTMTEELQLTTLAAELLQVLVENGSEPLPAGFVSATLPKLSQLLLTSTDGEILRPAAATIRFMLQHDHQQVLSWHNEKGQSGLDVCLSIIERLLAPDIEDNDASEVGGLAAELVEKAGFARLGNFLQPLLKAVAIRLASARAANIIQSLVLVFARLSLTNAQDVVQFLSEFEIGNQLGLTVVIGKWLENSINFAGYDEIRQNVIALSKLFSLNDPRLAQTMVKGDLIIDNNNSGRIMTRSRAKQSQSSTPWYIPEEDLATYADVDPDQYTSIPATLKILKVLVEELLSASGTRDASNVAAAAAADFVDADSDDGEDGWEDEPSGTLDLSLPSTRAELMRLAEDGNMRSRDDETQRYLTEFFVNAAREPTDGLRHWFNLLTQDEKAKLEELIRAQ